jgi:hypothetical protein
MSGNSPGLIYGQSPTAEQWNSYFAQKQDYSEILANVIAQGGAPALGAVVPLTGGVTMTGAFNVVAAAPGSAQPAQISQVVSNYGGTMTGNLTVPGVLGPAGVQIVGAINATGTASVSPSVDAATHYAGVAVTQTQPGSNASAGSLVQTLTEDRTGPGGNNYAYQNNLNVSTEYLSNPGTAFNYSAFVSSDTATVRTGCDNPSGSTSVGNSGYVVTYSAVNVGYPNGSSNAALMAAYVGKPLLPQVWARNGIVATSYVDQYNNVYVLDVPSNVSGAMNCDEEDMVLNNLDVNFWRSGYILNFFNQASPGASSNAGTPATIFQCFSADTSDCTYAQVGYRAGGCIGFSLDSRNVTAPTAVTSAAHNAAATNAPAGTPAPAAAPASIGGGAVIHVDSPSPHSTQFGGIYGFVHGFRAMGETLSTVSPSNPLHIKFVASGNVYQAVGYQMDGPGYEGGYLQLSTSLQSADTALGLTITRDTFFGIMNTGQLLGWEATGTYHSGWDSTQFGGAGGLVTNSNQLITGNLTIGPNPATASTDGNTYKLTTSSRDGGHYVQWNQYSGQTEWYDSGTALVLAYSSAGLNLPTGHYSVASVQVVGARNTGWTAGTGTTNVPNKGTMNYDTATLAQLASRVFALEQALFAATGHGLIGT